MKFKKGALYEVVFCDHSSDEEPIKFSAVGYVLTDHDDYVVITSWLPLNIGEHEDGYKKNCELFSIIKSCIIKRKKLSSGKEKE